MREGQSLGRVPLNDPGGDGVTWAEEVVREAGMFFFWKQGG
jgi:hypothetical protein